MVFENRQEAGIKLAKALEKYKGEETVVLALPRGGVVLGYEIAKFLEAPLDLVITKKIGHPNNPEYAIGAIAEDGPALCNPREVDSVNPEWLKEEENRIRLEIRRRREKYMGERSPWPVEGKTVILVDDGVATGFTLMAAIEQMKTRNPEKLVVAIPVTPFDTARKLENMVDELVSLDIDSYFLGSVGSYYEEFSQVEDDEVIRLLNAADEFVRH